MSTPAKNKATTASTPPSEGELFLDDKGAFPNELKPCASAIRNRKSFLKRVFDYVVTVPIVLLSVPLLIVVYLAIKIADRGGPAFFVQQREGADGVEFPFFKFRTMYIDSNERLEKYLDKNPDRRHEWETVFKLDNDPRVLPYVGNFLRKTSLDELPNLLNILRGEMSLVGPRPFPRYHLDEFDDEFRFKRSSVWPGLTGLWQIHRGGLVEQEKWDQRYIDSWSVGNDLVIFLRTIPAVLLGQKPHF